VLGAEQAAHRSVRVTVNLDALTLLGGVCPVDNRDARTQLREHIRGGAPHFDYVCQGATNGLTDVSVLTGRPIGFGALTRDNEQQALDRAGLESSNEDKGYEATAAALQTAATLKQFSN